MAMKLYWHMCSFAQQQLVPRARCIMLQTGDLYNIRAVLRQVLPEVMNSPLIRIFSSIILERTCKIS